MARSKRKIYPWGETAEGLALYVQRDVTVYGKFACDQPEGEEYNRIRKAFQPFIDRLVSGGLEKDMVLRVLWETCITYQDNGTSLLQQFEDALRIHCDGYAEAARQGLYRQNVYARSYNSTGFTAWEDRNWTSQPEELATGIADADRRRRAGQRTESPS